MKRIGQIFITVSLVALVLWVIPWLYNLMTLKPYSTPFTLYSCIIHDFTSLDRSDGKAFQFIDRNGNIHGDEVQPMFYASILASRGALPDTIEGRPVTMEEIDRNSIIVTSDPKDINRKQSKVHLLMESVPERLELKDPEEAVVSRKDGLYIYDMAANTLLKEKSDAFNAALRDKGFAFPARLFAGNPSDRKAYDEGYLVTDAEGKLFHFKQVDGTMEAEHFTEADRINLKHLIITEFENRATLGYLISADNILYMLKPDGAVIPTEVRFDPQKEDLLVVGDMFYYTIKVSDEKGEHFYALRSGDFSLADKMDRPYEFEDEFNLCEYIFPCRLTFTSSNDGWVKPRLQDFSWTGLIVDIVLAVLIIMWRRRDRNPHF